MLRIDPIAETMPMTAVAVFSLIPKKLSTLVPHTILRAFTQLFLNSKGYFSILILAVGTTHLKWRPKDGKRGTE